MSTQPEAPALRFAAEDDRGPLDLIRHGAELRGQYGLYIADTGLINAANTALGLELPLLLTGEPGCGKSDFAWVAAHALGIERPHRCLIRSDSHARDLLFHYDALRRFGDAQHGKLADAQDPRGYLRLRPLGVALMTDAPRQVVLIDEIDKAPRDLPNDLLHELDEGSFEIPELGDLQPGASDRFDPDYPEIPLRRRMERPDARKPFIVITSNAERQLPEPFLRRCVFYHIPRPTRERLIEIASARFPDQRGDLLRDLAEVFAALHEHTLAQQLTKPPTTSEMLEWVRAFVRLYHRSDVATVLAAFKRELARGEGKLTGISGVTWADLPGISCLIKHREDLEAIARHVAAR